jgi:hypothetical protein
MTRQRAISTKCKDCIHDPLEPGTWVAQVEACTTPDCALFPYRPKTQRTRQLERQHEAEGRDAQETSTQRADACTAHETVKP